MMKPTFRNCWEDTAAAHRFLRCLGHLSLVFLLNLACTKTDPKTEPREFDDHTVGLMETTAQYFDLAASGVGRKVVKYAITNFERAEARDISFYDGNFYQLHDEWYWFRLLNGREVPGVSVRPVRGLIFGSIEQIYDWAKAQNSVPLDLAWTDDGRLYSPRFYEHALSRPQLLGLGGLMYVPPTGERPAIWGFELEYSDQTRGTCGCQA